MELDPASTAPPFEQLRTLVLERIRSGDLAPGAQLPTVRALAEELSIATNTVARAYRELEAAGVLEGRGRNGTFVAYSENLIDKRAEEAAQSFATTMRLLGVAREHAVELARRAVADG